MASDRKLVVEIVGDDRSFQQALTRSTAAAQTFTRNVNTAMGRRPVSVGASFDPLLTDMRRMREQADGLDQRLSQVGEGFEGAGRSAGVLGSGLLGVIGKASAVGFAISAAYQASQSLQDALKATGTEAFTTTGRLENFAAALLNTDLIGAFQALRAQPKTLDDLGISVTEASNRLEALQKVADGTAVRLRDQGTGANESGEELQRYSDIVREAGTGNRELAQQLIDQVAALRAAENAQSALADSVARLGTVFRDVTGQAVLFKGAVDDLGGPRGPGGVDAINAALEQARGGQFRQAANPDNRVNANKQILARANGDLDEVLRLQEKERDRLKAAVQSAIGNEKERKALQDAYVRAQADVVATEKAIKAQNDAAKQAAATAAQQAREDTWSKIIGELDIGVTRAQLTKRLGDDLQRLEDLKAGLERQIRAGVNVEAAQTRLAQTEISIAGKQQEIRDRAAAAVQARQFRAIGLSATGEEIVPGVDNLRKRITNALNKFDSGDLKIGSKLLRQLKLARGEIRKEGDNLTKSTRSAIDGWLDTVEGSLQKADHLVDRRTVELSDKLLAALGFGRDADVARLSRLGTSTRALSSGAALNVPAPRTAMTGAIPPIHVHLNVDGHEFGSVMLNDLQRRAGRTSGTARGRFPGRSLGLG